MTRALPAWAQAIVPVDMDEAALLGLPDYSVERS